MGLWALRLSFHLICKIKPFAQSFSTLPFSNFPYLKFHPIHCIFCIRRLDGKCLVTVLYLFTNLQAKKMIAFFHDLHSEQTHAVRSGVTTTHNFPIIYFLASELLIYSFFQEKLSSLLIKFQFSCYPLHNTILIQRVN